MALTFKKASFDGRTGKATATYSCSISTPGRDGITVENEVVVEIGPGGAVAALTISGAPGQDVRGALMKLSAHCAMMADGLAEGTPSLSGDIPF